MIKAVIFDMDGLMIDSERVTFEGYQEVLKELSLTMSEEFYKSLLGKPIRDIHQRFYDVYGKDFPVEDVIKKVHLYMEKRFINEGVPVKQGLIELLQYLQSHNYKTIVATSSHRNRVDQILSLANITQYFDDSICGVLKSCEKLSVDTSQAIVLEDSEAGIQAAYSAHIPVICIPDMKYPEENYANKTTKILSSLDQVIDYLKENA